MERLQSDGRPMSAGDVFRAEPAIPYSSIYRTLAVLSSSGVLNRLIGADEVARFELADEVSGEHHHHLVCVICGAMDTIVLPGSVEASLIRAGRDAKRRRGFTVDSHRVELIGRCVDCQGAGPPRRPARTSTG